MKINFLGANRTVTGSNYLLEINNKKIVVDYGIFQGGKELEKLNNEKSHFDPTDIDYIIITHAHLDHSARVPELFFRGCNAKVLVSKETSEILPIMWEDILNIQEYNRKKNIKPFFTLKFSRDDIRKIKDNFITIDDLKDTDITDGIKVKFFPTGHILGSISAKITDTKNNKSIIFSGDIGHRGQRILKDFNKLDRADYLITESTYGNSFHPKREKDIEKIIDIIRNTTDNDGVVMIPAFTLQRTQEIIYEINKYVENGSLQNLNVFVDSPMATKITAIYKNHIDKFDKDYQNLLKKGDDPMEFENLNYIKKYKKISSSKYDNLVIIAGSGMCMGGRILGHMKKYISGLNNVVLIVGYQGEYTLGRQLIDGAKNIKIGSKDFEVKAKIYKFNSFSGHADLGDLMMYVESIVGEQSENIDTLKKIFITHGEESVSLSFRETLQRKYPNIEVEVPFRFDKIIL